MSISPARAVGWTIICSSLSLFSSLIIFELSITLSLILVILISTMSIKVITRFIILSAPFLIPLLLIHGVINPQFEQTSLFFLMPIRNDGILFAVSTYANISVFLALAINWWHVDRDNMIDWLIARKIPSIFICLIAQSAAMIPLIERRGFSVLRSQNARGIPTGPNLFHRIKAIPSIILPVITSLMNEADHRSYTLWSRGFGQSQFSGVQLPLGQRSDFFYIISVLILPLTVLHMIDLL